MSYLKKWIYVLPKFQNNLNHEKQVILLMIPNGKGWQCLVVKLSALRGISSKNYGNFIA